MPVNTDAKNTGQVEGWNEILDYFAAVVAGLVQAKSEVIVCTIVMREIPNVKQMQVQPGDPSG